MKFLPGGGSCGVDMGLQRVLGQSGEDRDVLSILLGFETSEAYEASWFLFASWLVEPGICLDEGRWTEATSLPLPVRIPPLSDPFVSPCGCPVTEGNIEPILQMKHCGGGVAVLDSSKRTKCESSRTLQAKKVSFLAGCLRRKASTQHDTLWV